MPQQYPAIGADVSGLMPPVGGDVSHLMGAAPAAPEPAAASGWLDSAVNFAKNFGHSVDPRPALKLLYDVHAASPWAGGSGDGGKALLEDVKGLAGAHAEQFRKAKKAYDEGRISEAVGHTLAGAIPLVGPAAAAAGEQIGSGDVSGGLGAGAGLLAGVAGPAALAKARSVKVPGLGPANPAAAEAIALAERSGVPLDAATATGNRAVRAVQHVVDRSLGGSVIAERAAQAQQKGLATLGEQLAAKGHPAPVTPEIAGQGVRDAVLEQVRTHGADADEAYTALRTIEDDPAHVSTIYPDERIPAVDAPVRFTANPKATLDEVFLEALKDARKQGYKGTAAELKGAFDDQVKAARSRMEATNQPIAEYGDAALLKSIRDLGGLRMFDKDFTPGAKTARLSEEMDSVKSYFKGQRVYTERGLANDDLVQQLRQDPRWEQRLDPNADMNEVLRDIAAQRQHAGRGIDPQSAIDLQGALYGEGVRPGVQWWSPNEPQTMGLAIDLRGAKAALKPIYDELMASYPVAQQQASKGLKALENIINGPDHAPLSMVDRNLGAIKSISRTDLPELRSISQGTAAGAVKQLEALVRARAAEAGPLAAEALDAGRAATVAKYKAADVLESLHAEPVKTFRRLTERDNATIEQLRAVGKQAPGELPKIGRAFLDDLLGQATANSGFEHAAAVASKWEKLGAETKRLLYKDPGYIKDLDSFFRVAKMTAENANPSGTAHTLLVAGQGGLIFTEPLTGSAAVLGTAALSKFLHSPAGVRILTKGLRVPMGGSRAASAAYVAEFSAFAQKHGIALTPAMADENQTAPGLPIVRR